MVEKKATKAKSTPKKRAVKKVEVSKSEINWDVIGFSSAAVTLLGASILFLIGWTRVSNWYGYFGVNLNNIDIPLPQILIQSLPAIVAWVGVFIVTTILNGVFFQKKAIKISEFTLEDWHRLIAYSLFVYSVSVIGIFFSFTQVNSMLREFSNVIPDLQPVESINYPFPIEFTYLLFIVLVVFIGVFVGVLNNQRKHIQYIGFLESVKEINKDFRKILFDKRFLEKAGFTPIFTATVLAIISTSALYGAIEAMFGYYGNGGHIQKVHLISPVPIDYLSELAISCSENHQCVYGPFGLITEDPESFTLVRWLSPNQLVFQKEPGIYIFPRTDSNGSIILVPSTQVDESSSHLLTVTPEPARPATITSTSLPVVTPTVIFRETSTSIMMLTATATTIASTSTPSPGQP